MLIFLCGVASCSAGQIGNFSMLEQQAESEAEPQQAREAIRDFDAVLVQEPRNARAFAHRASEFIVIGRSDLALNDVNRAIAIDGGTAFSYTVRALAEQNTAHGKDLALSDAGRAIALLWHPPPSKPDPDDAFVVLNATDRTFVALAAFTLRAEIRKERKQLDLALADVDAIIDIEPEMTSALVVRASIERDQDHFTAALQDDLKAMGQHFHSDQAISGLCGDYAALGRIDLAIRRCNEALVTAPGNALLYVNRGLARLKSGAMSAARTDFEQALVADPADALGVFGLGMARIGVGDSVGGREDVLRANVMDAQAEGWFGARGMAIGAPPRT